MIYKILSRHSASYSNLISYILNEEKVLDERNIITHNLKSNDIKEWTKEFIVNESFRERERKDQVYFYHELLSFSKFDKEQITIEKVRDIANKYMDERGRNGMYLGAIHQDRDHIHVHFCVSGLAFRTGKAFRLSKQDLQRTKINIQEYHKAKYPELSKSICEHGKGKEYVTDREYYAQQRNDRTLFKEQIRQTVLNCYTQSKTQQEFLDLLQKENLHHYERDGKAQGIVYEDMKFRFSRLGIEKEDLHRLPDKLPEEKVEEQKVMDEIEALRSEREALDKDEEKEMEENDWEYDDDELER